MQIKWRGENMAKYCPNCGAEVKKGNSFCAGCGTQIQAEAPIHSPPQPTPPPVAPPAQLQQPYNSMQPKKSNTGLIVGAIVAIVAIVVVLLLVFFVFGGNFFGGGSASDFVGTWNLDTVIYDGEVQSPSGSYITFEADGTYTAYGDEGTWSLSNNKININSAGDGSMSDMAMDYSFSNNKNTLTLSYAGYGDDDVYHTLNMVLSKN